MSWPARAWNSYASISPTVSSAPTSAAGSVTFCAAAGPFGSRSTISGSALTAKRRRFETPSGVSRRNASTPCGTSGRIVTTAVISYFFALSSIGASVRTTPFGISGFSIGISLIAVMSLESPGSLKIMRVAPAMLVPSIATVTRVPRSAPEGFTFSRVGGAVCDRQTEAREMNATQKYVDLASWYRMVCYRLKRLCASLRHDVLFSRSIPIKRIEPERAIVAARREPLAIGAERQRHDPVRLCVEQLLFAQRVRVPDLHDAIGTRGHERRAI